MTRVWFTYRATIYDANWMHSKYQAIIICEFPETLIKQHELRISFTMTDNKAKADKVKVQYFVHINYALQNNRRLHRTERSCRGENVSAWILFTLVPVWHLAAITLTRGGRCNIAHCPRADIFKCPAVAPFGLPYCGGLLPPFHLSSV